MEISKIIFQLKKSIGTSQQFRKSGDDHLQITIRDPWRLSLHGGEAIEYTGLNNYPPCRGGIKFPSMDTTKNYLGGIEYSFPWKEIGGKKKTMTPVT